MRSPTIAFGLEYPLAFGGGVSALVRELVRGMRDQFRLVLVSPDPPGTEAALREIGVDEHFFWEPAAPGRLQAQAMAARLVAAEVRLAHLHSGGTYTWGVRAVGASPFSALRRAGIPALSTVHTAVGLLEGYLGPQRPVWLKIALLPPAWLAKIAAVRAVETEIAVSRTDYEKLRRWYWPVRRKFRYIYHSCLSPADHSAISGARENVVLSVGHVARRKGQPLLAQAWARIAHAHPDWRLQIVGGVVGPDAEQEIRAVINERGLGRQIELLGEQQDVPDRMRRAGIFVQPSFFEGLPLALQEALFYGCACVATRIDGHLELVEHDRTGLFVPPGDEASLAAALEKLIEEPALRNRLGAEGAKSIAAKGMLRDRMIEQHRALYQSILQSRSP